MTHSWIPTVDPSGTVTDIRCGDCAIEFRAEVMGSKCPRPNDFFKPDGLVLTALLSRLMTRNTRNKVQRNADRLEFMKNVSNIAYNPALHLGFCVQLVDQYQSKGRLPTFETGLVMGAAMAMCSTSRASEKILKQMLADVERQQEDIDGEPEQGEKNDEREGSTAGK